MCDHHNIYILVLVHTVSKKDEGVENLETIRSAGPSPLFSWHSMRQRQREERFGEAHLLVYVKRLS